MAQYNITIDSEILHYLFLKGVKDEGMTKLLESVLNQVLQAQAAEQIKAEPYERTEEREDYRNGYYKRRLETRVGNIVLQIPRFRYGKFTTDLFQRYQRSEQALLLALMEMVVNGVSTRKIEEITYELCGSEFSRSTISELCKNLDPIVQGWISRPLNEKRFPFIIVDAMVIKVREEGRVRQRGLLIAIGINEEGYREVLGFMVGDSESEESWGEFFSWLKQRGLHGVDLIVSDQHKGLVRAISQYFQGAKLEKFAGMDLVLESKGLNEQARRKITGDTLYTITNLKPADDYRLAIESKNGFTAGTIENISISKGINDSIIVKLIEEPAKLTVIVTDDEGNIVESGYNLTFYDPARNFKQVGTGKELEHIFVGNEISVGLTLKRRTREKF